MIQKNDINIKISLAPLQGLTDYIFRNTFSEYFDGIDLSYSPFLRIENGEIRRSKLKDVLPKNNTGLKLIPQVLTNNSEDFLSLVKILNDMGYDEINWESWLPLPNGY